MLQLLVNLLLSPSSLIVHLDVRKKLPHAGFHAVFFLVTHEALREKGSTQSLSCHTLTVPIELLLNHASGMAKKTVTL